MSGAGYFVSPVRGQFALDHPFNLVAMSDRAGHTRKAPPTQVERHILVDALIQAAPPIQAERRNIRVKPTAPQERGLILAMSKLKTWMQSADIVSAAVPRIAAGSN